jgi:hypothetical protein
MSDQTKHRLGAATLIVWTISMFILIAIHGDLS